MILLEFDGVIALEQTSSGLTHSSTKIPKTERTKKAEDDDFCLTTSSEENPRWLIITITARGGRKWWSNRGSATSENLLLKF